jgi:hypothetical protein
MNTCKSKKRIVFSKTLIKSKKIFCISIVFLLVFTTFSSVVSSKGRVLEALSNIKDRINSREKPIKNLIQSSSLRERFNVFKERIRNTLNNIRSLSQREPIIEKIDIFSNSTKSKLARPLNILFSLAKPDSYLNLYTNYAGNEKTSPLKFGLPTTVDVDDDGDNDIRASFTAFPALENDPIHLTFNIKLKVDRLVGFEDVNEFFEVYMEVSFLGLLDENNTQDKIRFGYSSEYGKEVPNLCDVTYKYEPYFFYKEKPTHRVKFDPGLLKDIDDLSIVFGYVNTENNVTSSESKFTVGYSPVVKTDLVFGGTGDFVGRQLKLESSSPSTMTIRYDRYFNDSWFNAGLIIEKIQGFEFEWVLTPFKKGGGRVEYRRNGSDKVNVTMFFEKQNSLYIYVNEIPKHAKLSWTPEKDGEIEINTFGERIQEVGIRDTPPNVEFYMAKAYIKNLPSLAFINWNWDLKSGVVDLFCQEEGISAYVDIRNLLGTGTSILAEFFTYENFNMSFFWDVTEKSFGIRRTNTSIRFSLDVQGGNGSSLHLSARVNNTMDGEFKIMFGDLLDGQAEIQFTSNILEVFELDARLSIPTVGDFILQWDYLSFQKNLSGVGFEFAIINNTDDLFEFECTVEVYNGVTIKGLVVGFNDIIFPIPDINAGGYLKTTFTFGVTPGFLDYYISEDGSNGWIKISGGLYVSVSSTLENPIGNILGSIVGTVAFETESDVLYIAWETIGNETKVDIDGSGVLSLSGFEFSVTNKIYISIPTIVGEFDINTFEERGEVKLKLGESTGSFRTIFNISIPDGFDLELKFTAILNFDVGLSGYIGFAWKEGNITYISGGGDGLFEGTIDILNFVFRYTGEESSYYLAFDRYSLYGDFNLELDSYFGFDWSDGTGLSYISGGLTGAYDGSVELIGLSFQGDVGEYVSLSLGRISLTGDFDTEIDWRFQEGDLNFGLDLDSSSGTHFNFDNFYVYYGGGPKSENGFEIKLKSIDIDVYFETSIRLWLINNTFSNITLKLVSVDERTDFTITGFYFSGMGIYELSFTRVYTRLQGLITVDTIKREAGIGGFAGFSLAGFSFRPTTKEYLLISSLSVNGNGVVIFNWSNDENYRIIFNMHAAFHLSHFNTNMMTGKLFMTFGVHVSGKGVLSFGPDFSWVKLSVSGFEPFTIDGFQLIFKNDNLDLVVKWGKFHYKSKSITNSYVYIHLVQNYVKVYGNIEYVEFTGFKLKYTPKDEPTITLMLGFKLSYVVEALFTIKTNVSLVLDPIALEIELHRGGIQLTDFYFFVDNGLNTSIEVALNTFKTREKFLLEVYKAESDFYVGTNGYGATLIEGFYFKAILNGERIVELDYFKLDISDYMFHFYLLADLSIETPKIELISASASATIADLTIRDLFVNIHQETLIIDNALIRFKGSGSLDAHIASVYGHSFEFDLSVTSPDGYIDVKTFYIDVLEGYLTVEIKELLIQGQTTVSLFGEGEIDPDSLFESEYEFRASVNSENWELGYLDIWVFGLNIATIYELTGNGQISLGAADFINGIPERVIVAVDGDFYWDALRLGGLGKDTENPAIIEGGSFHGNVDVYIPFYLLLMGDIYQETSLKINAYETSNINTFKVSGSKGFITFISLELQPGYIEIKGRGQTGDSADSIGYIAMETSNTVNPTLHGFRWVRNGNDSLGFGTWDISLLSVSTFGPYLNISWHRDADRKGYVIIDTNNQLCGADVEFLNFLRLGGVEFRFEDLRIDFDLDGVGEDYLELTNDNAEVIEFNIEMFNSWKIVGLSKLGPYGKLSWNIDGDGNGFFEADTNNQEFDVDLIVARVIEITGPFRFDDLRCEWNVDGDGIGYLQVTRGTAQFEAGSLRFIAKWTLSGNIAEHNRFEWDINQDRQGYLKADTGDEWSSISITLNDIIKVTGSVIADQAEISWNWDAGRIRDVINVSGWWSWDIDFEILVYSEPQATWLQVWPYTDGSQKPVADAGGPYERYPGEILTLDF